MDDIKLAFTKRRILQEELEELGIWDSFRYERELLKKDGWSKRDAEAEAERRARDGTAEFPPDTNRATDGDGSAEAEDGEGFLDSAPAGVEAFPSGADTEVGAIGSPKGPTLEDLRWVYQNYNRSSGVTKADAPSPGAWGVLDKCRRDQKLFHLVFKALADDMEREITDDDDFDDLTGLSNKLQELFSQRQIILLTEGKTVN